MLSVIWMSRPNLLPNGTETKRRKTRGDGTHCVACSCLLADGCSQENLPSIFISAFEPEETEEGDRGERKELARTCSAGKRAGSTPRRFLDPELRLSPAVIGCLRQRSPSRTLAQFERGTGRKSGGGSEQKRRTSRQMEEGATFEL